MPHRDDQASVEAPRTPSRRLPLLDGIRIASPCNARWEDMKGDDRIRFCGSCEKHVYNLSAMAADEAEELLAEHAGSLCVRLYRRADGTVLTDDCPVGARKKRIRRALVSAAAGAGALAAAATAVFASQGKDAAPTQQQTLVTGKISEPVVMEALGVMGEPAVMGSTAVPTTALPPAEQDPGRLHPVKPQPTTGVRALPTMGRMAPR